MSQQTDKSTRKKQNNKVNKQNQNEGTRETAAWWLRGARCSSRHPFSRSQQSATLVLVDPRHLLGSSGIACSWCSYIHASETIIKYIKIQNLKKTTAETEAAGARIFGTWEAEAGRLEFEASLVYIGILGQAQAHLRRGSGKWQREREYAKEEKRREQGKVNESRGCSCPDGITVPRLSEDPLGSFGLCMTELRGKVQTCFSRPACSYLPN